MIYSPIECFAHFLFNCSCTTHTHHIDVSLPYARFYFYLGLNCNDLIQSSTVLFSQSQVYTDTFKIGLLFLRDLVMVDPDDRIEVSTVTKYYNHELKDIDENTKLDDMLDNFKV